MQRVTGRGGNDDTEIIRRVAARAGRRRGAGATRTPARSMYDSDESDHKKEPQGGRARPPLRVFPSIHSVPLTHHTPGRPVEACPRAAQGEFTNLRKRSATTGGRSMLYLLPPRFRCSKTWLARREPWICTTSGHRLHETFMCPQGCASPLRAVLRDRRRPASRRLGSSRLPLPAQPRPARAPKQRACPSDQRT